MRLSPRIVNAIKQSVSKSFGDADIYLFGSRIDDAKRGGDIDIAIDSVLPKEEFRQKKIQFLSSMMRLGIDLEIDVVSYHTADPLLLSEVRGGVKL